MSDVTWVKPYSNERVHLRRLNIRPDSVPPNRRNYPLEVIPILNQAIAETAVITVSEKVAVWRRNNRAVTSRCFGHRR